MWRTVEFRPTNTTSLAATDAAALIKPVSLAVPTGNSAQSQAALSLRLSQLELNQPMPAQVQAQLSNSTFLVNVADTLVQMNLPTSTQVGDHISVTLLDNGPQPTFLLNTNAGTTLSGSVTELSPTGQLINALMQLQNNSSTQSAVVGRVPLLDQPPSLPAQLADALATALNQSGLFYEAHVNLWSQGQLPLATLQSEPQANQTEQLHLPVLPTTLRLLGNTASANANNTVTQPSTDAFANSPSQSALHGQMYTSQSLTSNTLTQLVQQQLHVLENHQVIWQGQAWPGQPLQWSVDEHPPPSHQQEQSAQWHSDVKLDMPTLGLISANLQLDNGLLSLRIQAHHPDTVSRLTQGQTALADAYAASGITLQALQIQLASDT